MAAGAGGHEEPRETEAPLASRLAESLVRKGRSCFNPRYHGIGMLGYPFFVLCELLSPVVGAVGVAMSALLLEARAFRKYPSIRDTLVLTAYAIVECFGYRQPHSFWKCRGLVDCIRKRGSLGQPLRRAF